MYMPPAASDQTAVCPARLLGAEPLGVICCQELPCRRVSALATGRRLQPKPMVGTVVSHIQAVQNDLTT